MLTGGQNYHGLNEIFEALRHKDFASTQRVRRVFLRPLKCNYILFYVTHFTESTLHLVFILFNKDIQKYVQKLIDTHAHISKNI